MFQFNNNNNSDAPDIEISRYSDIPILWANIYRYLILIPIGGEGCLATKIWLGSSKQHLGIGEVLYRSL